MTKTKNQPSTSADLSGRDLNQQLREDARELRSLADKYLIEEGHVVLRDTIPAE